jgi:invasion protein IalB
MAMAPLRRAARNPGQGRIIALAIASLLAIAAGLPAFAQQAPAKKLADGPAAPAASPSAGAPQNATSSSTFEDWTVRCQTTPPAPKACEVAQTIATRNPQQQQSPIAEIVFGHVAKTDPMLLVVQLPPGVYLPTGVTLVVDDKSPPLSAVFTRCLQTCMAQVELKLEIVQALRATAKSEPGRLEFEDGAQRKLALPVSFKGLAAALAARDAQVE